MSARSSDDGKLTRVLQILAEGPATSSEVAAELDVPSNQASALLAHLQRQKRAHSTEYGRGPFGMRLKLWHEGAMLTTTTGGV